eukprot:Tbor_TRINITY_DN5664_c0_g1::TRINITY_DN5664_c0_g1_i2::g.8828::m.8828/K15292/STXBP1, MUNC18-1; syntaxin-binding protein 1
MFRRDKKNVNTFEGLALLPHEGSVGPSSFPSAFVSTGVKGSIKNRILADMIGKTPGDYKIIVADVTGTEILNSCMKMHDLMQHKVTLVEDIDNVRQPIQSSPVIYFVAPTSYNISLIVRDWATSDMYREAHVFFVSMCPKSLLTEFKGSRLHSSGRLKGLTDLLICFHAPERLVFTMNEKTDLPFFYGAMSSMKQSEKRRIEFAGHLAAVIHTLSDLPVVIRHQNNLVATDFARMVQQSIEELAALGAKSEGSSEASQRPCVVVIVDRTIDSFATLVHDLGYQAMLEDLMPLNNNIYTQIYKNRTGKDGIRQVVVDEEDEYWCRYRHHHFSVCLSEIPKKLQELIKAYPQLSAGMEKGSTKLSDLGAAVRALPKYQEQQGRLSLHIDLIGKLYDIYKAQKLDVIVELEQKLVNGIDSNGKKPNFKDVMSQMKVIGEDNSIRVTDKTRLLMLVVLSFQKDLSERSGQEKFAEVQKACGIPIDDTALQMVSTIFKAGIAGAAHGSAPKKFKSDLIGTYYTHIKTVMEDTVTDTLSTKDFPYLNPSDEGILKSAVAAALNTSPGKSLKSLKTGGVSKNRTGHVL